MSTETISIGGDSKPIKTYDERLEQDIAKIIVRNCVKEVGREGGVQCTIKDLANLTIELIEFFREESDNNRPRIND